MIVTPLKIQGKKTKLVSRIKDITSSLLTNHPDVDTWVEPFLGSGVVAFNAPNERIRKVIVNDINPHIIQFYECINNGTLTGEIVREAFEIYGRNLLQRGGDYYNEVKDRFNEDFNVLDFLFLTRTGFNGVMRFNSKGKWNVPFCKLNDRLSKDVIDELVKSIDELSRLFKTREYVFYNKSFEDIIDLVPKNSIFYCDPPYYGLATQYYKGWGEEQEMLLNEKLKGKVFLYSTWVNDGHKDNPMIDRLWRDYTIDEIDHKYMVAGKSSDRMKMIEGLIYSGEKVKDVDEPIKSLF